MSSSVQQQHGHSGPRRNGKAASTKYVGGGRVMFVPERAKSEGPPRREDCALSPGEIAERLKDAGSYSNQELSSALIVELKRQLENKKNAEASYRQLRSGNFHSQLPVLHIFTPAGSNGAKTGALSRPTEAAKNTLPRGAFRENPDTGTIYVNGYTQADYEPLAVIAGNDITVMPPLAVGPDGQPMLIRPGGAAVSLAQAAASSLLPPALVTSPDGTPARALNLSNDVFPLRTLLLPGSTIVQVDKDTGKEVSRRSSRPLVKDAVPDADGTLSLTVRTLMPLASFIEAKDGSRKRYKSAAPNPFGAIPAVGDLRLPLMQLKKKPGISAASAGIGAGASSRSVGLMAAATAQWNENSASHYVIAPALVAVPGPPFVPYQKYLDSKEKEGAKSLQGARHDSKKAGAKVSAGDGLLIGNDDNAVGPVLKRAPMREFGRKDQGEENRREMEKLRRTVQEGTCHRCGVDVDDVWAHLGTKGHKDESTKCLHQLQPAVRAIDPSYPGGAKTARVAALARLFNSPDSLHHMVLAPHAASRSIAEDVNKHAGESGEVWRQRGPPGRGFQRPMLPPWTRVMLQDGETGMPLGATADVTEEDMKALNWSEPASSSASSGGTTDVSRLLPCTDVLDGGRPHPTLPRLRLLTLASALTTLEEVESRMALHVAMPGALVSNDSSSDAHLTWKHRASTLLAMLRGITKAPSLTSQNNSAGGGPDISSRMTPAQVTMAALGVSLSTASGVMDAVLEAASNESTGILPRAMLQAAGVNDDEVARSASVRPVRARLLKVDPGAVANAHTSLLPFVNNAQLPATATEGQRIASAKNTVSQLAQGGLLGASKHHSGDSSGQSSKAEYESAASAMMPRNIAMSAAGVLHRLGLVEKRNASFHTAGLGPFAPPATLRKAYHCHLKDIARESGWENEDIEAASVAQLEAVKLQPQKSVEMNGPKSAATSPTPGQQHAAPLSVAPISFAPSIAQPVLGTDSAADDIGHAHSAIKPRGQVKGESVSLSREMDGVETHEWSILGAVPCPPLHLHTGVVSEVTSGGEIHPAHVECDPAWAIPMLPGTLPVQQFATPTLFSAEAGAPSAADIEAKSPWMLEKLPSLPVAPFPFLMGASAIAEQALSGVCIGAGMRAGEKDFLLDSLGEKPPVGDHAGAREGAAGCEVQNIPLGGLVDFLIGRTDSAAVSDVPVNGVKASAEADQTSPPAKQQKAKRRRELEGIASPGASGPKSHFSPSAASRRRSGGPRLAVGSEVVRGMHGQHLTEDQSPQACIGVSIPAVAAVLHAVPECPQSLPMSSHQASFGRFVSRHSSRAPEQQSSRAVTSSSAVAAAALDEPDENYGGGKGARKRAGAKRHLFGEILEEDVPLRENTLGGFSTTTALHDAFSFDGQQTPPRAVAGSGLSCSASGLSSSVGRNLMGRLTDPLPSFEGLASAILAAQGAPACLDPTTRSGIVRARSGSSSLAVASAADAFMFHGSPQGLPSSSVRPVLASDTAVAGPARKRAKVAAVEPLHVIRRAVSALRSAIKDGKSQGHSQVNSHGVNTVRISSSVGVAMRSSSSALTQLSNGLHPLTPSVLADPTGEDADGDKLKRPRATSNGTSSLLTLGLGRRTRSAPEGEPEPVSLDTPTPVKLAREMKDMPKRSPFKLSSEDSPMRPMANLDGEVSASASAAPARRIGAKATWATAKFIEEEEGKECASVDHFAFVPSPSVSRSVHVETQNKRARGSGVIAQVVSEGSGSKAVLSSNGKRPLTRAKAVDVVVDRSDLAYFDLRVATDFAACVASGQSIHNPNFTARVKAHPAHMLACIAYAAEAARVQKGYALGSNDPYLLLWNYAVQLVHYLKPEKMSMYRKHAGSFAGFLDPERLLREGLPDLSDVDGRQQREELVAGVLAHSMIK